MKKIRFGLALGALVAAVVGIALVGSLDAAMNFVADGGSVTWTNGTGSAVYSGELVDMGDFYVVALGDVAAAASGVVKHDGQWTFRRVTTNATTIGSALYYSTATSLTATAASDTLVGHAVKYTGAGSDKIVYVELNTPHRPLATTMISVVTPYYITTNFVTFNGSVNETNLYVVCTNVAVTSVNAL